MKKNWGHARSIAAGLKYINERGFIHQCTDEKSLKNGNKYACHEDMTNDGITMKNL